MRRRDIAENLINKGRTTFNNVKNQVSTYFQPPERATLIGHGYRFGARPKSHPIYSDPERLANGHLICCGSSGFGKSRWLFHLITERIRREDGVVVVFDPHSDLHQAVFRFLAQQDTLNMDERVVLIEPVEMKKRGAFVGINPLYVTPNQEPYEIIDDQIACYRAIWPDAIGDRMISIIRNCSLLACQHNLTLSEINLLLTNEAVRNNLVGNTDDEKIQEFFEFFTSFTAKERHFFVESSRNKLEGFTRNPYLAPIISQQQPTIRFDELLNRPGTVILINSSEAHLKRESRRLFDALLFTLLNAAILDREALPEAERVPVYIFADESPEIYVPSVFRFLLSGSRKFGVSLHLFSQTMSLFPPEDMELIFSNCATKACFRVDHIDARLFSQQMGFRYSGKRVKDQKRDLFGAKDKPLYYSTNDEEQNVIAELKDQHRQELFISIDDGRSGEPFVATTPKISYPPPDPEAEEVLREAVYRRYTQPLHEIEAEVRARRQQLLDTNDDDDYEPNFYC